YTLNKLGSGQLVLTGTNSFTGGTNVEAGDLTLKEGGTINTLTADSEVQQLKIFGANRVGATNSITAGSFTIGVQFPGTTQVINTNAIPGTAGNPTSIAGAITTAINAVLANFNLSTGAANQAGVTVTSPSAATANPYVFNINFNQNAQANVNFPKLTM